MSLARGCRAKGIGRELVARNLARADASQEVYVVCPAYRTQFYENCGFQALTPWELPKCATDTPALAHLAFMCLCGDCVSPATRLSALHPLGGGTTASHTHTWGAYRALAMNLTKGCAVLQTFVRRICRHEVTTKAGALLTGSL